MSRCYDFGFDLIQFQGSALDNQLVCPIAVPLHNVIDPADDFLLEFGIQILYFEVLLEYFHEHQEADSDPIVPPIDDNGIFE